MAAFQPHGGHYRTVEILGSNGKATVQPLSPLRLTVDLEQAAGPYNAGEQTLQPAAAPGPAFAPDFVEMASLIRQGAKPTYSPDHDLNVQQALLEACHVI